jgi:putative addiction module CopG family antidote
MPLRKTRNISVTLAIRTFIDGCVGLGRFRNASEVVRAAAQLLKEDERQRQDSLPSVVIEVCRLG